MKKVLATVTNLSGDEIPSSVLFQEDGLLRLWEINCYSALHYGLGNCYCENHLPSDDEPISSEEVIRRFGKEALNGFDPPGREQLVFDAFGVKIEELEAYLRVSYRLGVNPLPALRRVYDLPIVFGEDPDMLIFPEEKPGTKIFIFNSRGEIAVRDA